MEEASHDVVGDRNRAQRGVHGSTLDRGAGCSLDQQFGGAGPFGGKPPSLRKFDRRYYHRFRAVGRLVGPAPLRYQRVRSENVRS